MPVGVVKCRKASKILACGLAHSLYSVKGCYQPKFIYQKVDQILVSNPLTKIYLLFMAKVTYFELCFLYFFSCLLAHLKALKKNFKFRPSRVVGVCLE